MRIDSLLTSKNLINYLLYPFSVIFSIIVIIRRYLYEHSLIKSYVSKVDLISIGNIVGGGSGKTPFTIFLAKTLQEQGFKIAVSHRGYKGAYENQTIIIADENGIKQETKLAGDEPRLLTEKLPGIPIIVGKNRTKSLQILQEKYPDLDFILLDDSFQHLQVKKQLNYVLFNSSVKLGNGFVFPAGILREPLCSLKFADLIVYNGTDEIPTKLKEFGRKIVRISYRITKIYTPAGKTLTIEDLKEQRIALISGIGQPLSFEKSVKSNGIPFSKHYVFPDHYSYSDLDELMRLSVEVKKNYDYLLTTEKDYTKLEHHKAMLPLAIVAIEISTNDKTQLLEPILKLPRD